MADVVAKIKKGTLSDYLKMPEMRTIWVLAVLFVLMAVVALFDFSLPIRAGGLFLFVVGAATMFIGNKNAARTNYATQGERNLLGSIVTNFDAGVIAYDANFVISLFNPSAEQMFDVKGDDVLDKPFTLDLATKDARFKLLGRVMFPSLAPEIIKRSEPGAYPQIVDLVFENPFAQLRVRTDQIIADDGQIIGFIKVIQDRTRDVNLLKSKDEFITVASHQLRTPLTAVNWVFQELGREGMTPEERAELLATGTKAANKLGKTVNDFLDLAKSEEGKFGYVYENTDIVAFTEKVVSEASAVAQEYKIKVYFDKPASPITVPMDPTKMDIVFSNLIDNAIKYNVEGGEVVLRIKPVPGQPFVELTVADSGVGLSDEDIQKIFTKFFRAANTVKINTEGSGLGLYLAKNIVEQHGGKIWAESILGRGTTVHFTLPTDVKLVRQKEVPSLGGV